MEQTIKTPAQTTMQLRLVVHKDPDNKKGLFDDDVIMTLDENMIMLDVFDQACDLTEIDPSDYEVCSTYEYDPQWNFSYWKTKNNHMRSFLYDDMLTLELRPI